MFLFYQFKSSIDNCLIEWDLAAGFFPHDREPQEYHWPVDAQGCATSDSESFAEVCRRRVNEEDSDDDVAVPEPRPKKGKTDRPLHLKDPCIDQALSSGPEALSISKGKQGSSKGKGKRKGKGKGPPMNVVRPPSQSSSSAAAEEPQVINHQPVKSAQLGLVELFTI